MTTDSGAGRPNPGPERVSLAQCQAEFDLTSKGRAVPKRRPDGRKALPTFPTVDSLFRVPPLNNLKLEPEQALQVEVYAHLRHWRAAGQLPGVVFTAIPNELAIPSGLNRMAAMVGVKRKAMGCIPGAFDFVFTWHNSDGTGGGGWIELKKPAGGHRLVKIDDKLRSRKSPAGRLREDQERFRDWCDDEGVPRAICRSLEEVKAVLVGWGILRLD